MSIYRHLRSHLLSQAFGSGVTQVDSIRLGGGLHTGGSVDGVPEEAEARVHVAHHAAHHRARVEAHTDVHAPASAGRTKAHHPQLLGAQ